MKLPEHLILHQIALGPMDNFLYFIGDRRTGEIAVVDPAWDVDYLCSEAKKNNYTITSIFLTHCHMDHLNGLKEIVSRHDVPVYVSGKEHPMYKPKHPNLVEVDDGAKLQVGGVEFDCILAPGHSPGSQCFKHENVLIAGDVIFIDGCGRCDLPGGDARKMYNSLYNIIMKLPDETIIYPGHDYGSTPYATVAQQKKTNPYLQCHSVEEFLQSRMGIFS